MTNINLLEKKSQENSGLKRIRAVVNSVTTTVLVLYIIVIAGFLGYEWWLNGQQKDTQEDLASLTAEVMAQSTEEVLVRKIDSRSRAIDDFLTARPNLVNTAENVTDERVRVIGWEYSAGGIQRVEVSAGEPELIAEFTRDLADKYSSLAYEVITWDPDEAWSAVISLGRLR